MLVLVLVLVLVIVIVIDKKHGTRYVEHSFPLLN